MAVLRREAVGTPVEGVALVVDGGDCAHPSAAPHGGGECSRVGRLHARSKRPHLALVVRKEAHATPAPRPVGAQLRAITRRVQPALEDAVREGAPGPRGAGASLAEFGAGGAAVRDEPRVPAPGLLERVGEDALGPVVRARTGTGVDLVLLLFWWGWEVGGGGRNEAKKKMNRGSRERERERKNYLLRERKTTTRRKRKKKKAQGEKRENDEERNCFSPLRPRARPFPAARELPFSVTRGGRARRWAGTESRSSDGLEARQVAREGGPKGREVDFFNSLSFLLREQELSRSTPPISLAPLRGSFKLDSLSTLPLLGRATGRA